MTRLYFVRHVEAEGNLYRICEGQYNGALSPRGEAQLSCVSAYFADIPLDAVYSSDLYRAYRTAQAAASASGLPVIPCRGLREYDFGSYEGESWGDINRRFPEEQHHFYHDLRGFRAPGGESAACVAQRMTDTVKRLANRHPGGSIVIVGHSAAMGTFFPAVQMPFDQVRELQYMKNASVTVMDWDGERFHMVRYNDTSHLSHLPVGDHFTTRPKVEFSYRFADPVRDRDWICHCGEAAWQAVYGNLRLFSMERFYENARGLLLDHSRNGIIPLADGQPAGILLLDSRQQDEPATGHISLIYLQPEFRGMGLGAQLIGKAVVEYRRRGMDTLRLNVASVNQSAQRFYTRLRFRREETRRPFARQYVMRMSIAVPQITAQE
ncbi:MAG: GNAT family N-acetyltransferase [Ruminococcaceae bacterium]|nr:GNAT family N-acetyltransferase [Oscillospiraceae bacterium]